MLKPVIIKKAPIKMGKVKTTLCKTLLWMKVPQLICWVNAFEYEVETELYKKITALKDEKEKTESYYSNLYQQLAKVQTQYKKLAGDTDFQLRLRSSHSTYAAPLDARKTLPKYPDGCCDFFTEELMECPITVTLKNGTSHVIDYIPQKTKWQLRKNLKINAECDIQFVEFNKAIYKKIDAFVKEEENKFIDARIEAIINECGFDPQQKNHHQLLTEKNIPIGAVPSDFVGFNLYEEALTHPVKINGKFLVDLGALLNFWEDHPECKYTLFGTRIFQIEYDYSVANKTNRIYSR